MFQMYKPQISKLTKELRHAVVGFFAGLGGGIGSLIAYTWKYSAVPPPLLVVGALLTAIPTGIAIGYAIGKLRKG